MTSFLVVQHQVWCIWASVHQWYRKICTLCICI